MAGRRGATSAKKTVTITTQNLLHIGGVQEREYGGSYGQGGFYRLECCAFIEFDGVGHTIKSVEDAVALRRAASGDLCGHESEDGLALVVLDNDDREIDHKGAVLVTTIPSQSRVCSYLEGAGFTRLGTFKGNTGNLVTLWGAQVLGPGKIEPKSETREIVTL